jgi:transcription factor Dp-1
VYDALNVLMAMDIITKEKKMIQWRGLPTNTQQEGSRMQMDLSSREDRLNKKRLHLQELLTQQISFKNLINRNKAGGSSIHSGANGSAAVGPSSSADPAAPDRIPLPFIIVNSGKETVIDCEMAEDKQEIFFNFSVRCPPPPRHFSIPTA